MRIPFKKAQKMVRPVLHESSPAVGRDELLSDVTHLANQSAWGRRVTRQNFDGTVEKQWPRQIETKVTFKRRSVEGVPRDIGVAYSMGNEVRQHLTWRRTVIDCLPVEVQNPPSQILPNYNLLTTVGIGALQVGGKDRIDGLPGHRDRPDANVCIGFQLDFKARPCCPQVALCVRFAHVRARQYVIPLTRFDRPVDTVDTSVVAQKASRRQRKGRPPESVRPWRRYPRLEAGYRDSPGDWPPRHSP